jgi:hypothetical protein
MGVSDLMMNCIWESYIQDKAKEINNWEAEEKALFKLPEAVRKTKEARAVAMDLVVKRKQAFYGLTHAWQECADKKAEGVIIMQPWVDAVERAQEALKQVPRERVVEAVKQYCGCLSNVATLYSIAMQGIYNTERVTDWLFFF